MGRKFLEGLVFGAGIAVAFIVVLALGLLAVPVKFSSGVRAVSEGAPHVSVGHFAEESGPEFYELTPEEQIKKASVIALARYEPAADGKMKAIVKEFLKKEPNTTIYYRIGDEYPEGSFYPTDSTSHGEGLIVFFVGSPATMSMSMTYSGGRIRGLGDIPLELFREKCKTDE